MSSDEIFLGDDLSRIAVELSFVDPQLKSLRIILEDWFEKEGVRQMLYVRARQGFFYATFRMPALFWSGIPKVDRTDVLTGRGAEVIEQAFNAFCRPRFLRWRREGDQVITFTWGAQT